MAWDETSKKVAIKAIGTVESSMKYDSINYNDPITVGIAQWYGPRAADIIKKMGAAHPTEYAGVSNSLKTDLNSHGNDQWWTNRWLSKEEGNSLLPLLRAGAKEQDAQLVADLEGYFQAARNLGIDPNTNTDSFIYWCVAYHQGPRYAIQVANNVGGNASLDAFHHATLNNGVLGKYPNRYNQAYQIIKNKDTSGVSSPGAAGTVRPGNGGSGGATNGLTLLGTRVNGLPLRTGCPMVVARPQRAMLVVAHQVAALFPAVPMPLQSGKRSINGCMTGSTSSPIYRPPAVLTLISPVSETVPALSTGPIWTRLVSILALGPVTSTIVARRLLEGMVTLLLRRLRR